MIFHWPHFFWLLLAPALLLARDFAHRRRTAAARSHPKILRAEAGAHSLSLAPGDPRRATGRKPRLWLAAGLVLATVALARPQWGKIDEPVFDQSREILLALDLSRSMNSPDVPPSRLDRARLLIQSLLDRLQGERVGLVVFSGTAFLQSPLSGDYEILREFLPSLNTSTLPEGGTNYRELLETALDAFGTSSTADRYLIILSDGEATDDDWRPLIPELKQKNIRVIALGVGTAAGTMIPDGAGGFVKDGRGAVVLSKLDSSTLRELAEKTGGVYSDASEWVDLPALLNATVEAGRRGKFREAGRVRLAERFQWALAPALLCLLMSFWYEFPVHPRTRDIRLTPPAPDTKTGSQPASPAAALLLFAALGLCGVRAARADDSAGDVYAAPLQKMAAELALRDNVSAHDWERFAQATLDYGNRTKLEQKQIPDKAIGNALDAVRNGEAADPKAADWPELRRELETLRKKPDQPKPPPQQKKSPQQQKKDSDQKQDQKQNESQNNPSQDGKSGENSDSKQPKDQKSPPNKSGQNQSQKGRDQKSSDTSKPSEKNSTSSSQNQNPSEEPARRQLGPSAFGDMKKPAAPPRRQPADARPLQKFGGTPAKKTEDAAAADPSLAVPLQKLDQLKQQDSPATLYELMRGENKPPPSNGKNW